jgi:hypothetical protein
MKCSEYSPWIQTLEFRITGQLRYRSSSTLESLKSQVYFKLIAYWAHLLVIKK